MQHQLQPPEQASVTPAENNETTEVGAENLDTGAGTEPTEKNSVEFPATSDTGLPNGTTAINGESTQDKQLITPKPGPEDENPSGTDTDTDPNVDSDNSETENYSSAAAHTSGCSTCSSSDPSSSSCDSDCTQCEKEVHKSANKPKNTRRQKGKKRQFSDQSNASGYESGSLPPVATER